MKGHTQIEDSDRGLPPVRIQANIPHEQASYRSP